MAWGSALIRGGRPDGAEPDDEVPGDFLVGRAFMAVRAGFVPGEFDRPLSGRQLDVESVAAVLALELPHFRIGRRSKQHILSPFAWKSALNSFFRAGYRELFSPCRRRWRAFPPGCNPRRRSGSRRGPDRSGSP